jgi:hypothetical protein
MAKATFPTIPNAGAMSEFIGAFDVPSKVTDFVYRCRFSHCWNGIATRHADTMDCKFFVDGKGVVLGLAHPGFVEFRTRSGRNLTDREASYIGAEYLRELSRSSASNKLQIALVSALFTVVREIVFDRPRFPAVLGSLAVLPYLVRPDVKKL